MNCLGIQVRKCELDEIAVLVAIVDTFLKNHRLPNHNIVMAEDGQVYEKQAIEEYVKTRRNNNLPILSPMTGKKMSQRLVRSIPHKTTIQNLIDNGIITGALADQWNAMAQAKKAVDDLLQKSSTR
jgi:hypothetical protein